MKSLGTALACGAAFFACALQASDAAACGAIGPPGSYVRLAEEDTLIVWDSQAGLEHFIRKPVFEGDPKDFGFLVPTPVVPAVGKVEERVFQEMWGLFPAPKGGSGGGGHAVAVAAAAPEAVKVEQRVQIDDFELVTLRAAEGNALADWIAKHGFATRPSIGQWADRYARRGWVINAMRYAPKGRTAPGQVTTPTVRLSFAIDAPFYPYTEAPPDAQVEELYIKRSAPLAARHMNLFVLSPDELAMNTGPNGTPGPTFRQAADRIPGARIAAALGDTRAWKLDPSQRTWHLARYDETGQRVAFDDLTFVPPSAGASDDEGSKRPPLGIVVAGLALLFALGVAYVTNRNPQG